MSLTWLRKRNTLCTTRSKTRNGLNLELKNADKFLEILVKILAVSLIPIFYLLKVLHCQRLFYNPLCVVPFKINVAIFLPLKI